MALLLHQTCKYSASSLKFSNPSEADYIGRAAHGAGKLFRNRAWLGTSVEWWHYFFIKLVSTLPPASSSPILPKLTISARAAHGAGKLSRNRAWLGTRVEWWHYFFIKLVSSLPSSLKFSNPSETDYIGKGRARGRQVIQKQGLAWQGVVAHRSAGNRKSPRDPGRWVCLNMTGLTRS